MSGVGTVYAGMAGSLEGLEGADVEGLRAAFGTAGAAFSGVGGGTGTAEEARAGSIAAVEALSRIDRSTAAGESRYREVMERVRGSATDETSRATISGISTESERRRHLTRALSGRGRRGPREARETVLSELTGGTFGTMEFNIGGDRTVSGTRAMDILARGGEEAELILQQIGTNLSEASGNRVNAEDVVSRGREALESLRRGRGRMSEEEITRFIGGTVTDPTTGRSTVVEGVGDMAGMREVRANAAAAAMESARAGNPLDARRNDILEEIRDRLPTPPQARSAAREAAREVGAAAAQAVANAGANPAEVPAGEAGG